MNVLGNQQVRRLDAKVSCRIALDYLVFLPRDYAAKPAAKWPLMLFLHGAGERGCDLRRVAKFGPPKIVKNRSDFPFLLVSPQCPTGERWSNLALFRLLDEVESRYRVDRKRIYLTGLSMGGYGTWSLGLAEPRRFAAIAPICGGGDTSQVLLAHPRRAPALRSLPVWAFHGAKDSIVPLDESRRMVEVLKRCGAKDVRLTIYPDADHDAWTTTYANPELYEWFFKHRRR